MTEDMTPEDEAAADETTRPLTAEEEAKRRQQEFELIKERITKAS